MPTGYQIDNPAETYFLTFTVVDWVDIFSRKRYRDILINSLDYCRKNKGLKIFGYVTMTNHMHSILRASNGNLSDVVRDFKRFTATEIIKSIALTPESRRDWMEKRFVFAAKKNMRNSNHQFWTHSNHAEIIFTEKFFHQKLKYIHENPVSAGWVENPSEWMYSSMRNYMGMNNILEIDVSDL